MNCIFIILAAVLDAFSRARVARYLPAVVFLLGSWLAAVEPGKLRVITSVNLQLHDRDRNCDVMVTTCYPEGPSMCPVLIFSHGAYGSAASVHGLADYWASHGYAVILPTHADSLTNLERGPHNDPWTGKQDLGVYGQPATQGTWKPIWEQRPQDIAFVVDHLTDIANLTPGLAGRLDLQRIGIGGHSLGAYAAELVCGVRVEKPGKTLAALVNDTRPKALLLLSPQGRGLQGLADGSWDDLKVPTLLITGTFDFGIQEQPPQWRTEPYLLSPAGNKYLMLVEGANHNSCIGHHIEEKDSNLVLQRKGEADMKLGEAIFDDTKRATLLFWDAYVKEDAKAMSRLRSSEMGDSSAGRCRMQWR